MNRPALRFMDTLDTLDRLFVECSIMTDLKRRELILSWIVIKLHDQWNFRSRQIVLESYNHSEKEMLEILRQNWGRKVMQCAWEPDWHIPTIAIRAAQLLKVPDISQIRNAIGAVTYIDDIRWTRNAIVHNIPASFSKYQEMALNKYGFRNIPPHLLSCSINPNTGNTVYEDWCVELKIALSSAIYA